MAMFIIVPKFFLLSFLCMSTIGLEDMECLPEQYPFGEQVFLSLKDYQQEYPLNAWMKVDESVTIQQRRIQNNSAW